MEATQWKGRVKSAGFPGQFNTFRSTDSKSEIVLNISGKKLFQNSCRTIWDYNPNEIKNFKLKEGDGNVRKNNLQSVNRKTNKYFYKPPLDLNINHSAFNAISQVSIGPPVSIKTSDVFDYMPTSTNNFNTPQMQTKLVPPSHFTGQHESGHLTQTNPNLNPKQKSPMNIASTYAIENDSFQFGFTNSSARYTSRDPSTELSTSKKHNPKKVKDLDTKSSKYLNRSMAYSINDQFGSESLKKSFPIKIHPVKIKAKLEASSMRSEISRGMINEKSGSETSHLTQQYTRHNHKCVEETMPKMRLMYGEHIDELTSDLIANLSKGIDRKSKDRESSADVNENLHASENEDEPDYEDIRPEYNEYYELVNKQNTPASSIEKLIHDIQLIKRDHSAASDHSERDNQHVVILNNNTSLQSDPHQHHKHLGKRNCEKVLNFERQKQLMASKSDLQNRIDMAEKRAKLQEINKPAANAVNETETSAMQESVKEPLKEVEEPQMVEESIKEPSFREPSVKETVSNEEQGEFPYPEVVSRDCRKLLNKYDNLDYSADQFIRNNLSLIPAECANAAAMDLGFGEEVISTRITDVQDSVTEDSIESDASDVFNLLKRMLVKKKYVLYTIKQENLYKKQRLKRMNTMANISNQAAQPVQASQTIQMPAKPGTRPSTASANTLIPLSEPVTVANVEKMNQQRQQKPKLNRPKTANTIPGNLKFANYSSSRSQDLQATQLSEKSAAFFSSQNQTQQKSCETELQRSKKPVADTTTSYSLNQIPNPKPSNIDEYYYPFRSTALEAAQKWPFEFEFDRYVKKRNYCSNKPISQLKYLKDPVKKLPNVRSTTDYCEVSLNTCNPNRPLYAVPGQSKFLNLSTKAFPMKSVFLNNCKFIYQYDAKPDSNSIERPQNASQTNQGALAEVVKGPSTYANATLSSSRRCFSAKTQQNLLSTNHHTRNLINLSINSGKQDTFKEDSNSVEKNLQSESQPSQPLEKLDEKEADQQEYNHVANTYRTQETDNTTFVSNPKQCLRPASSRRVCNRLIPGKSFTSQRKNSISYELVVPTKKHNELQQLKVPLSQYQVPRTGSAKKIFQNIEGLKELALQHQKDILALSDRARRDNRMVIYGISEIKQNKSNKDSETNAKCQSEYANPTSQHEVKNQNAGYLSLDAGNKFRTMLMEKKESTTVDSRPKTAKT